MGVPPAEVRRLSRQLVGEWIARLQVRQRGLIEARREAGKGSWSEFMENAAQLAVLGVALAARGREHWLRRLRPHMLGAELAPGWTERRGLVYALASPYCKRFYIGKTDRSYKERFLEHVRAVEGRSVVRVHRFVRSFGLKKYIMVPLCWAPTGEAAAAIERKLIRSLQPALNTHLRGRAEEPRGKRTRGSTTRRSRRWACQRRRLRALEGRAPPTAPATRRLVLPLPVARPARRPPR